MDGKTTRRDGAVLSQDDADKLEGPGGAERRPLQRAMEKAQRAVIEGEDRKKTVLDSILSMQKPVPTRPKPRMSSAEFDRWRAEVDAFNEGVNESAEVVKRLL